MTRLDKKKKIDSKKLKVLILDNYFVKVYIIFQIFIIIAYIHRIVEF